MNVECRYEWYDMLMPMPFSNRIVFYLRSRHPERHHPTLLVLAHLHYSLHRLFDWRGHRLGSLGTWDRERQQSTHPAEGWRVEWCVPSRLKSFGVHVELLGFLLSFGMLTAGLTTSDLLKDNEFFMVFGVLFPVRSNSSAQLCIILNM